MSGKDTIRDDYAEALSGGTARFFHPRQETCPWCISPCLRLHLRTTDLLQHKPGNFVLDRCETCGHIFQNPRLNEAGLAFYYRDFYDGLGHEEMAAHFAKRQDVYRRRAEAVAEVCADPADWIDVGAGHGHFCESARMLFPNTRFDGLDSSDGIEDARAAGHLRCAFRAPLPAMAAVLKESYDVVSMYHYLEHTTAPLDELLAARKLLRPGGYLVIEVPDPASRFSRWLGRYWLPWLQPQHLHFIPRANLECRLEESGFIIVASHSPTAHDPVDLVAGAWLALDAHLPRKDHPWLTSAPSRWARTLRSGIILAATPALMLLHLADRLLVMPLASRLRLGNAYRVIARLAP